MSIHSRAIRLKLGSGENQPRVGVVYSASPALSPSLLNVQGVRGEPGTHLNNLVSITMSLKEAYNVLNCLWKTKASFFIKKLRFLGSKSSIF